MVNRMTDEHAAELIEVVGRLESSVATTEGTAKTAKEAAATANHTAEDAQKLAKKQRRNQRVMLVVIAVLAFMFFEQRSDGQDLADAQAALTRTQGALDAAQDQIEANAVTACTGGNERLGAQERLWLGLVVNSAAETPAEARAFRLLSDYIKKVFLPRDCDHLEIPYEAPDEFPDLGLKD